MNPTQEIQALKKSLNDAIRNKNVDDTVKSFAEASVMFVLPPPLRFNTGEQGSGTNRIEQWFASFESEIALEFIELNISANSDLAFCHCLEHMSGKRTDGTQTDMWYRETLGLKKIDGQWKITHQHQSVPMHMDGSGKAAVGLKP